MKKILIISLALLAGCAPWVQVGGPFQSTPNNFSVELPEGWMRLNTNDYLLTTRDGVLLQNIRIIRHYIDQPLVRTKKSFEKGMLPQEIAEVIVDDLSSTPELLNFEVMENSPAEIAGIPGFRLVFGHKSKDGLRFKNIRYGFMADDWVYSLEYSAAARYYFEKDLGTFERVVSSFRLVETA